MFNIIGERVGSRSGSRAIGRKRSYTRVLIVETDQTGAGPLTIRSLAGIPKLYDTYASGDEADASARCKSITPRQISKFIWEVTCVYETLDSEDPQENPLNRPYEVSWSGSRYSKPVYKDIATGRAIASSAGQPFDPPPEADNTRLVLSVARNEASFNHLLASLYADAVNSDQFFGAAPGYVKSACPKSQLVHEEDWHYWRTTYEFEFHPDGWNARPLDAGTYYLDSEGNKVLPAADGTNMAAEILLNGSGGELASGGTPFFHDYQIYRRLPFASLGL